jgi:hypothetical protein
MTPDAQQTDPLQTPEQPPWGTPGQPVSSAPVAPEPVAPERTVGERTVGEAQLPGRPRRDVLLGTAVALTVMLVGVLIAVVVTRSGNDGARNAAATASARPTAGPESPTTPAGERPWAGTVPPPSSEPAEASSDDGTVATGLPTSGTDEASFCIAAKEGLATVGGQGLEVLKTLTTQAGDVAPRARTLVTSALEQADRLRRSAPQALTAAVGTLQHAWQDLASELEKAGYGRAELALLSVKYLTNPAVAAATEMVGTWSAKRCGIDLLGVQDTGG